MRLIRASEKGLDRTSSDASFVLTHVDMVKHSPGLILGATLMLNAIASSADRATVHEAFSRLLDSITPIESSMEGMWAQSKPKDCSSYRTLNFGITDHSVLPSGVVYAGHNDHKLMFFRGESDANDSIIPLLDVLLEIPMPTNLLTETLKDFRDYRPKSRDELLVDMHRRADELGVRRYYCEDTETAIIYLRMLDRVRSFRW